MAKLGVLFRQLKFRLYLKLGATLINKTEASKWVTVYLRDGKQIKSNKWRTRDYSFDDKNWEVLVWKRMKQI